MRELYVYYRAKEQDSQALRQAVRAWQAELASRFPGLVARLLRRPEVSADGLVTWMEVYAATDASPTSAVSPAMEREIQVDSVRLDAWLVGARHVEVFEACA